MQLQVLLDWLPQIAVTLIPGIIHQWLAARELEIDLAHFPIFNLRKSPRYWALRCFFFILPVVLFWALIPLIFRVDPPSAGRNLWNWTLWGMAIALGWRFTSILNASISIASAGVLDFGPFYQAIVGVFRQAIIKNQEDKTSLFWNDIAKDLVKASDKTGQQNYVQGQQCLYTMLSNAQKNSQRNDQSRQDPVQLELNRRLKKISPGNLLSRNNPHQETLLLLRWLTEERIVSRAQLPTVLNEFGCNESVRRYFPTPIRKPK